MWWLYLVILILILLYLHYRKTYSFWDGYGIPVVPYTYLIGSMNGFFTKGLFQTYTDIYRKCEGYNYVAFYDFQTPTLLARSPQLIKQVLSTNFKSFHDNYFPGKVDHDVVMSKNPFFLEAEQWKTTRNHLTPSFTTNKLKAMIPMMVENNKKMVRYIEAHAEAKLPKRGLEAKELCSKIAAENVASCAFGLEGRCFIDEKSEFRKHGRTLTQPSAWNAAKQLLILGFPVLAEYLKIKLTADDVGKFLKDVVVETINYRKANNVRRNDFLDMMVDVMNKIGDEREFNVDDIVSHSGGFFMDGYETTSAALCFVLYNVAKHPEIQAKLRREIEDVLDKYKGEVNIESLQDMKYLDCVWKESLRMYMPAMALVKKCTEPFKLPPLNEDGTGPTPTIPKGVKVLIPILGVQRDPKHFKEAMAFKPERFYDENKDEFPKDCYLPFGDGPRTCLGQRFGVLVSKLTLIALVKNFKMTVNSKTREPLEIYPYHFLMLAKGGLWLNYEKV